MKIRITLIAIALSGLIAGVAFAGPLVLSELDVKPYIHTVEGPKADFEVETIFANFTILDPDDPASGVDEPSVKFQLWVNVTNPSEVNATLMHTFFTAAGEITPFSGVASFGENSSSVTGGIAEGAFVDGKWYDLTWVNVTWPFFDSEGNMCESPFPAYEQTGYWMEGVQLCRRYVNGDLVMIYMNMNGTWTDVTDRIEVEEPKEGSGFTADDLVAEERRFFQPIQYIPDVSVEASVEETSEGSTVVIDRNYGTVYVPTGNGYFDNYFEAGESRILLIEGIRTIYSFLGKSEAVSVLNSGSIDIHIGMLNYADRDFDMENNTVQDTTTDVSELKTLELTKVNNSFIYNLGLLEDYAFTVDEWNAEVFLEPR